ncbi:glutathione S-transferase family protein [Mangrovicoccus algicola]|uniref:Glutathione S-transferase family protein n=1 Tax=Mangrovicoccus algicola TaxID=2771008 RepID=A0A8J7CM01_9RHOB|nr:glutathione S-transferase family protein [Mangrovicoccus algicola]MBE3640051.1 glutathione S-transferase family protein [Mangrovicoccus algicola]
MTFTLYNDVLDAECYKVRLLAALLGLSPRIAAVEAHPGAGHRAADFLALNPAGTLPVAAAGDLVLSGAPAILVWMAAAHDVTDRWYPRDPGPMAQVQAWLETASALAATAGALRREALLEHPAPSGAAQSAEALLRRMELHLLLQGMGGRGWLVGTHPTVADIACFADVALAPDAGIALDPYPALHAWTLRLRALPDFLEMPGIAPLHALVDPLTGHR